MKKLRHPIEVYEKGKSLFLSGKSIADVAREIGVAKNTVANWCKSRSWVQEQENMLARVDNKIGTEIGKLIETKQRDFIRKNIQISEDLTQKAQEMMEKSDDPYVIAKVADIAQKSHKIGSQTLGLDSSKKQGGPSAIINVQIVASAVDNIKQAMEIKDADIRVEEDKKAEKSVEVRSIQGGGQGQEPVPASERGREGAAGTGEGTEGDGK